MLELLKFLFKFTCQMFSQFGLFQIGGFLQGGRYAWRQEIEGYKTDWKNFVEPYETSNAVPIDPRRMVADMVKISPNDTVMVDDVGNCQAWSEQYWKPRIAGTHLTAGGFAAMGFGVCGVLGAKLARPQSPCVTLCGDGGFMMTPHAVATAVEYNIPAVWVLQNNYAIGCIRDLQRFYLDGREIGTAFYQGENRQHYNPDFAAWARAAGAEGQTVTRSQDFAHVLEHAIAADRPFLIDVHVDAEVRPPATGTWALPPLPAKEPVFGGPWRPHCRARPAAEYPLLSPPAEG